MTAFAVSPGRLGAALRAAALGALVVVAGCGLLGPDEPAAPVDACPRVDPSRRALAGVMVRQPEGVGSFEIVPVEGRAKRSGAVGRIEFGDYVFKARDDGSGGLLGRRGARATPVAGVDGAADAVSAFDVAWRQDGQPFAGSLVAGAPTPGTRVPTNGRARYAGPVRLTVRGGASGEPVVLTGTAEVVVGYGSGAATLGVSGLRSAGGAPPFAAIEWTGIGLCGARLGSNGAGGFRTLDAGGRPIDVVGPGGGSPGGAAVVNAVLYGEGPGAAPAAVGGVLLIQGDAGSIAGVFAASAGG